MACLDIGVAAQLIAPGRAPGCTPESGVHGTTQMSPSCRAVAQQASDRLGPSSHTELGVGAEQVTLDRADAEDQPICDLGVREPVCHELKHLGLARAQLGRAPPLVPCRKGVAPSSARNPTLSVGRH